MEVRLNKSKTNDKTLTVASAIAGVFIFCKFVIIRRGISDIF